MRVTHIPGQVYWNELVSGAVNPLQWWPLNHPPEGASNPSIFPRGTSCTETGKADNRGNENEHKRWAIHRASDSPVHSEDVSDGPQTRSRKGRTLASIRHD